MTNIQLFPERLRNERFAFGEGISRVIDYAGTNLDPKGLVDVGSKAEGDLATIIKLLGAGSPIPDKFYRNYVGNGQDELLNDFGIKHLHLGGSTSDILLFLVEFEGRILLLEINDHNAFAESPRGSTLRMLHQNALAKADVIAGKEREAAVKIEAEKLDESRLAIKRKALQAALRPRKPSASEEAE